MEEPAGGTRAAEIYFQVQRLEALLASGTNDSRTMERGRNTKRIPGTIRIVFEAIDNDAMLRRHTGKRWRHSNSYAVGFKQEQATGAQPRISLFDLSRSLAPTFFDATAASEGRRPDSAAKR